MASAPLGGVPTCSIANLVPCFIDCPVPCLLPPARFLEGIFTTAMSSLLPVRSFARPLVLSVSLLALSLLAVATVGCGPSGPTTVVVTGKLLKGGQPLPVPRADIGLGWVQIQLDGEGDASKLGPQLSRTKEDGSFEFQGDGGGILPGSYKMSVVHYEQGPPNDSLKGAFAPEKSTIRITVPADKGNKFDVGTIDLDNPPKN
jgi:hypothetical protein